MKRTNKPHQEYFLVATGNQAMRKSGNLLATGSSVNLSAGQLGAVDAATNAYLTGGETITTNPKIYLVQGTAKSSDFSALTGWHLEEQALIQTPHIEANTIMSFTTKLPVVGTHSTVMLSAPNSPVAGTRYAVNMKFRSVRKDRTYGGNLDQFTVDYVAPTSPTVSGVLGNLVYNINKYSKLNNMPPLYSRLASKKHVLALALDLDGGGSGTALGTMAVGDSVAVGTDGTNTMSVTITKDLLHTIYRAITDTAIVTTTKVVSVNPSTVGAGAVDALLLIGLDHEESLAFDDINQKKVTVEATYTGFTAYTETKVCDAREWQGTGREYRIWYDERAYAQTGSQQLTGFQDEVLRQTSYITESSLYTASIIDLQNEERINDDSIHHQTRIWILLPATDTSSSATGATGITTSTNAASTLTDLEAIVGVWIASNANVKYLGAASASNLFI